MASKNHFTTGRASLTPARCLGCHGPIVYGERCAPCQRELRQRQQHRRKRRLKR